MSYTCSKRETEVISQPMFFLHTGSYWSIFFHLLSDEMYTISPGLSFTATELLAENE